MADPGLKASGCKKIEMKEGRESGNRDSDPRHDNHAYSDCDGLHGELTGWSFS